MPVREAVARQPSHIARVSLAGGLRGLPERRTRLLVPTERAEGLPLKREDLRVGEPQAAGLLEESDGLVEVILPPRQVSQHGRRSGIRGIALGAACPALPIHTALPEAMGDPARPEQEGEIVGVSPSPRLVHTQRLGVLLHPAQGLRVPEIRLGAVGAQRPQDRDVPRGDLGRALQCPERSVRP